MITLDQLPRIVKKSKKRIGRGTGSGKGNHTVGKGQKGQKTRESEKLLFEGTKSNKDFFRKTPMLRGKGKLKSHQMKPIIIKSSRLSIYSQDEKVTLDSLVTKGLISERQAYQQGVKIVFDHPLIASLTIEVPASKAVRK